MMDGSVWRVTYYMAHAVSTLRNLVLYHMSENQERIDNNNIPRTMD